MFFIKKCHVYLYIHIHFFKKIYIKSHIYIFGTGRDWDDLVPCPVPKLFGTKISRLKMPWDGTSGTRNFEHPYS